MLKSILSLLIVAALMLFADNAFCQNIENDLHLRKLNENLKNTDAVPSISLKNQPKSNHSGFGIRGGIGTDITFSPGFGLGAFYVLAPDPYSSSNWDLGFDIYYSSVSEDETEGSLKYEDNTKVLVFGFRANGLFNYHPYKSGVYFIAGTGLIFANVDWKEDIIYSYPYAPHTEHWSDDAFSVGNILNLGVGLTFGSGVEARFETPFLIFYSVPGYGSRSASSVVPTFTLSVLYRFPKN
jgi:hypothetical protein